MDSLDSPKLDTAMAYQVSGLTISSYDLKITLDSGCLAFYRPIVLDSTEHRCAAYFSGRGRWQYRPTPEVERGQLTRFFDSDSLDRTFSVAVVMFDDSGYRQITSQLPAEKTAVDQLFATMARKECDDITKLSDRPHVFSLVNAIAHPSEESFLCAYANLNFGGDAIYKYDPNDREQVSLSKRYHRPGINVFEYICRYATNAVDITTTLNGKSHDVVTTKSYLINSVISEKGIYTGSAQLNFECIKPLQMLELSLHLMLAVDSVTDSTGQIKYRRYKDEDKYWYMGLYLYYDQPLQSGSQHTVTVWSHGDICERWVGEFYVTAGAFWYPRYGFKQPATFELNFKTPKQYTFVSAGRRLDSRTVGDTLESHWEVTEPTSNISFSIGNIKKFEFSDTLAGSVDVYFSESLHREFSKELAESLVLTGSHMEKQVSGDVINALRLYSHQFGRYQYGKLSVSEILLSHGEAFPGFIHMGVATWVNTDRWGYQQLFRSHEVAHQWWGVGVGYETYHDQWLSEGFAEYSALMYLQAVKGNDGFLDRMKEYRKEVVSVREKPTDSSSETGPIILGYRTSSTKSEGDASLIIYKKGALVLHMLRNLLLDWRSMKEDKFFALMKEWYMTYRGKAASTEDFIKLTEKYSGEDMTWFFDQWVYNTEIPTYKLKYEVVPGDNNTFTVKGHITTEGVSPDFRMYVPLEIRIDDSRKAYVRLNVDGQQLDFSLPGLPAKPKELKLNPFESVLAEVKQ